MKKRLWKITVTFSCLILLLFASDTSARKTKFRVGKIYHGFKLVKERHLQELDVYCRLFKHVRTGARLIKLEAKDDNKSFSITFKFLPDDDTGVAHIIEHATLGSSHKFRVKSPIQMLLKGSLHTFVNAFTSQEFIMFPIASRNKKDFFNMINVYLDMVFHPLVYQEKNIFLQEAWRYDLPSKDNELTYNGIVYNEMKGYYSSPDQLLSYYINKNLLPNTIYANDTGGNPQIIPKLTYKKFLAFHKKYFHPSNSYITLYGDGNTLEELKFIHDNYLSEFKPKKLDTTISLEKSFKKMKDITVDYPIGDSERPADKTYLSLNFATGGAIQPELTMALQLLSDLLANLPSAPLRMALTKAGIGKDIFSGYDDSKQGVFSIVVKNANLEDKDRFRKVVFDTLRQVVASGLDKKQIEGTLNRLEFKLREADFGSFPKGLVYTYISLRGWLIGNDPFLGLEWKKPLANIRAALKSNYLEKLIEKHLVENPHALLLALRPKPGMEKEIAQNTKIELSKIKSSMSDRQLEALVEQTKQFKQWQSTPDKPEDIQKIPMLSLEDIDPKTEDLQVSEKQVGNTRVLHFNHSTNGIIYLQLLFDAATLPQEMIPYLPIFADLLGKLDTEKFDFGDLDAEINIHTGGIQVSPETFTDFKDTDKFMRRLSAWSKVLAHQLEKLMDLQTQIIQHTRFGDKQRLKQVLDELNSRLQNFARNGGQELALKRLQSQLSSPGMYSELTQGLSFIQFVSKLTREFDQRADDLIADLELIASLVFSKQNLIVGITCSEKDYRMSEPQLSSFLNRLGDRMYVNQPFNLIAEKANEALLSPSKVQYVTKGANFRELGYGFSGKLNLLSQILTWDYLVPKIRMEGGAYGSFVFFRRDGLGALGSYRDPHVVETLSVYDKAADFIQQFKADKREMTRYIIGTISKLDKPMTPSLKGSVAIQYHLENITQQDRQKERDELLAAEQQDVRKMAKMISDMFGRANICVYGNEKKLKDHKNLFDRLVQVVE